MPEEIARKLFYKLNEVCQITDTQPYVLRFWESEFAQLAASRSRTGQRLYRRKDIDLVLSIKKLIQDEGLTIAGVRERLGMNGDEQPIEGLYEPAPAAPPEPSRALAAVTRELREILNLFESTDRRLPDGRKGKRG